MENIDLRVASRPPRIAFVYRTQAHVDKIVSYCTKLWGGQFNLMLTKSEFKKIHNDLIFDFVVPLVKLDAVLEKQHEHKTISETEFFSAVPMFVSNDDILPALQKMKDPVRDLKSNLRNKDKRRASFYFGHLGNDQATLSGYGKLNDFNIVSGGQWIVDVFDRSYFTPLSLMGLDLKFVYAERPMNVNSLFVVQSPLSMEKFVTAWNLRACGHRINIVYEDEIPTLAAIIKKFGETKINRVGANQDFVVNPNIITDRSDIQRIVQSVQTNVQGVPFVFCDTKSELAEALRKSHFSMTDWENKTASIDNRLLKVDAPSGNLISQIESDGKVGVTFQTPFGAGHGRDVLFHPPAVRQKELAYLGMSAPSDMVRIHDDFLTKFENCSYGKLLLSFNNFFDFWSRFFKIEHGLTLQISKPGKNVLKIISSLGGLQGGCRILKLPSTRALLHKLQGDRHLTIAEAKQIINQNWGAANPGPGLHFFSKTNLIDQLCTRGIAKQGYVLPCKECENSKWYALGSVTQTWTCDFCDASQRTPLLVDKFIGIKANGLFQIKGGAQGALTSVLTLWRFNAHNMNPIFLPSFVLKNDQGQEVLECDFMALQNGRGGKPEIIIGESKSKGDLKSKDFSQLVKLKKMMGIEDVYFCFAFLHDTIQSGLKTKLSKFQKKHEKTIVLATGELNPYEIWDSFPAYGRRHIVSLEDLSQATAQKYL